MGLLVGLPLKLFHFLFIILRFTWPLLLILAVCLVVRRKRRKAGGTNTPDFKGPVVEVDYRVISEEDESKEGDA